MLKIDMWYGDKHTEADRINVFFNDCDCMYRGNIYKDGKNVLEIIAAMIPLNWKKHFHN